MANYKTGAQRYNDRQYKIFNEAKKLGQQRYLEEAKKIKELTEAINQKAQKFTKEPCLHFDDLRHVLTKLTEIDTFLK
jgi:uncharacterized phage infection (PIP) family protein YhgE